MNLTEEQIKRIIEEELEQLLEEEEITEDKICPKGKAWAKRTFDTYPSAYANLAASKYCKDPNYAKGSKKKSKKSESIEEGDLQKWVDEDWVRVTSSGKIAGKCGTSKDKKNPDRCLPRSKASKMSKGERAATGKKKKAAQKSGKDSGKTSYVSNTKKGKVTKSQRKSARKNESLVEAEITDDEREELEDVSKQLKGAVKAHGNQAKTIDKALKNEEVVNEEELEEGGKCTKVTKKASSSRDGKKWMKCVRSDSGGFKRIHWGQAGVRVTGKSGNTKRKKSFKKRHNCSKAKSNTPQGQACKDWAEE